MLTFGLWIEKGQFSLTTNEHVSAMTGVWRGDKQSSAEVGEKLAAHAILLDAFVHSRLKLTIAPVHSTTWLYSLRKMKR